MKSLSEKINEALFFPNTGYDECDELTREYGNLFGMFSNTLLRKTPFGVYVLTGSSLRSGVDFLFATQFNAEGKTASQWFDEHNLKLYRTSGASINSLTCANCTSSDDEDINPLDPELLSSISGYVKDNDYLIVL